MKLNSKNRYINKKNIAVKQLLGTNLQYFIIFLEDFIINKN
jgi:hypothetical protein